MKECRKAGGQACRRTGIQADRQMYRKTDVQIYIQTYRNKDLQTYTDKLTDRQCRSEGRQTEQADRCTESRMFKHSVHTYGTYRKTDRQTGQT
jgi:hypothetical protein